MIFKYNFGIIFLITNVFILIETRQISIPNLDLIVNFSRSECNIAINGDLVEPQPLFIIPGTERFIEPNPNGIIKLTTGQSFELLCTKSFKPPLTGQSIIATCLKDDIFIVNDKLYYFDELVCTSNARHIARRTGEQCYDGASIVENGFEIGNRFFKIFDLCHNELIETTLYVHHRLTASSAAFQKSVSRVSFIEGDFYNGKNVDKLYTKKEQMKTVGEILSGNHEKYFDEKKDIFMARGHLAAKTDLIYGSQQRGTFYFINAAPQWQRFNAGNWERIENSVRKLISLKNTEVDCYTGTWGIMELHDINNQTQQLFLSFDENNNGQIPVPKLYYRVVYEPATKLGIVLIGVNNIHATLEEIDNDYIICSDISDQINWINWVKDDISKGYSYACEVEEFADVVGHLPNFDIKGIFGI